MQKKCSQKLQIPDTRDLQNSVDTIPGLNFGATAAGNSWYAVSSMDKCSHAESIKCIFTVFYLIIFSKFKKFDRNY